MGVVHLASTGRSGLAPAGSVLVAATLHASLSELVGSGTVGLVLDSSEGLPSGAVPFPVVLDLPPDLFREGESVEVDGDRGRVELAGVRPIEVVTAFLERNDGRILLLRRSARVGSFQGRWAGVSGFLEDPTPEEQAYREVREETGLASSDLRRASAGRPIYARDEGTVYVVHPFRFRVQRTDVRLDWEHTESAWVDPSEIGRRPTVPHLDRAWRSVAPGDRRKG